MSAKTKIVVLRMKELIYTGIFVALGILLIILLIAMFLPKGDGSSSGESNGSRSNSTTEEQNADEQNAGESSRDASSVSSSNVYIPGIYTTQLVLNDQSIDVEVIVDQSTITSIRLVNLSESVTTMYPLLEPAFESICEQIYATQSVDEIAYASENKYTTLVLLEAVKSSLEKAYTADTRN